MASSLLRSSLRRVVSATPRASFGRQALASQRFAMSTTSEVARLDRDDEDLQELPQETVEGLRQIFFEKSTAAERYRYFAKRADSEGQVRAASYFRNLARSESEHAQEIISAFEDATGVDPTTGEEIGNTFADLEASLVSEMHDCEKTFPSLIESARNNNIEELAEMYEGVASADQQHIAVIQELIASMSGQAGDEDEEEE